MRSLLSFAVILAAAFCLSTSQAQDKKAAKKDPAAPLLANVQSLADYNASVAARAHAITDNEIARKKVIDSHRDELGVLVGREVNWKVALNRVDDSGKLQLQNWHGRHKDQKGKIIGMAPMSIRVGDYKIDPVVDVAKLRGGQVLIVRGVVESVDVSNSDLGLGVTLKDVTISMK